MQVVLDLMSVAKELLGDNIRFALVRYIFRVQRGAWARLDYERAAAELGVDRRTISRCVKDLVAMQILDLRPGELRIARDLIKEKKAG